MPGSGDGTDAAATAQGTEEDALRVRGLKERDAKGVELKEQELKPEGGDGPATGAPQTAEVGEAGARAGCADGCGGVEDGVGAGARRAGTS